MTSNTTREINRTVRALETYVTVAIWFELALTVLAVILALTK